MKPRLKEGRKGRESRRAELVIISAPESSWARNQTNDRPFSSMSHLRPKRVQTNIGIFSYIQKWINLFLKFFFFKKISPEYTKDVALVYGHLCFLVCCFSLWLSLPLHSQVHGGDTWPPAPSAVTGSGRGMRIIWILTRFCLQKRLDMQSQLAASWNSSAGGGPLAWSSGVIVERGEQNSQRLKHRKIKVDGIKIQNSWGGEGPEA